MGRSRPYQRVFTAPLNTSDKRGRADIGAIKVFSSAAWGARCSLNLVTLTLGRTMEASKLDTAVTWLCLSPSIRRPFSRRRLDLKEMYPRLRGESERNHLGKTTLSKPERDLNLDLPVIGSLVHCRSSALDHAATEAGF
uniref:Uncharacterized protein n=1 Tax=Timema poppense TaxID=170557 RepID=A0A7R9DNN0_TIMPO|nr:unnamed protein product [Timema poppensis]